MDNILKVFSNNTRVKILACLAEKDRNVTGLIKNCGLSQSAVSQHLKKLKDADLINCENNGREKLYKINQKIAGDISNLLLKLMSLKNNKKS
jgi:predicted transcriptional regulator